MFSFVFRKLINNAVSKERSRNLNAFSLLDDCLTTGLLVSSDANLENVVIRRARNAGVKKYKLGGDRPEV